MALPQLDQAPQGAGMIQSGMGTIAQGLGDYIEKERPLPEPLNTFYNQMIKDPHHAAMVPQVMSGQISPEEAAVHVKAAQMGQHPNPGAVGLPGTQQALPTDPTAVGPPGPAGQQPMGMGDPSAPQAQMQSAMGLAQQGSQELQQAAPNIGGKPDLQATVQPKPMYQFKVRDLPALKQAEGFAQVREQALTRAEIAEQNRNMRNAIEDKKIGSREKIEGNKETGRMTRSEELISQHQADMKQQWDMLHEKLQAALARARMGTQKSEDLSFLKNKASVVKNLMAQIESNKREINRTSMGGLLAQDPKFKADTEKMEAELTDIQTQYNNLSLGVEKKHGLSPQALDLSAKFGK